MSPRTVLSILTLGVAVGVVLLIGTVIDRVDPRAQAIRADDAMIDFLEAIDTASLSAVTVRSRDDTLSLVRRGPGAGDWVVEGHPADSSDVVGLLESLARAAERPLLPARLSEEFDAEVERASAREVVLHRNRRSRTLLVGERDPGSGSVAVRLPSSEHLYILDGELRFHAVRSEEGWRSPRVAAVDTGSVGSVQVRAGESVRGWERTDTGWVADGARADTSVVGSLLRGLSEVEAAHFRTQIQPGGPGAADGPPADRIVLVRSRSGDELLQLLVWMGAASDGHAFGLVRGRAAVQPNEGFALAEDEAERLAPDPSPSPGS